MSKKLLETDWKPLEGMSRVSWGNHRNDGVVWGIERKADLIEKMIKSVSGFEKKKKYSCIYTNGVYTKSLV